MGKRGEALMRIAAFLWGYLLGFVIGFILLLVGLLWMLLDVLWQLLTGSEGLDSGGTVATWFRAWTNWSAENRNYAVTGDGSFQAIPQRSMG